MLACSHPPQRLAHLFPATDYLTGDAFRIARCDACGFIVTVPQPAPDAMSRYYPARYYGSAGDRRFPALVASLQNLLYRRRARRVERLAGNRPGRILDVGCGRGFLLRAFQQRGWEVQGTELSDEASQYGRQQLNLPIQVGALDDLQYPDTHFDAVTMWHVLEHVSDPRVVLAAVHRILKPGGVFLVATPNFGSVEARLTRDKWFHLDVPRHLTHFTPESLSGALRNAGFELRARSGFAPEYDSFSFIQSLLNHLGVRHNLLYNLLSGRSATAFPGGVSRAPHLLATFALSPILGVLSMPATPLAAVLGQGATMTFLAVKKS